MSHFTPIKLPIKDGNILRQVLQEMNYKFHECDDEKIGYGLYGLEEAELGIVTDDGGLFFFRDKETYKILTRGIPQTVINGIVQRYVQKTLIATMQQQSFIIKGKETLPEQTIPVVVKPQDLLD